ncbi:MAG: protein FlhF [Proteobacteria bacterium]|nr:protein FlhF [Pseudomonadota bacterium]MBU1584684.1 protein FlhF [Pseudomonadota bacterium]MBU2454948.1 protein FlhF [Pseudomonadota bacterium]MBU2628088.1 protein FlhF [Pseudomonadota bacterium]
MNRKVFKAENIQQAIQNIKEELGSDAMILSTRKIPKKPLDPYAKTMFEVEASLPQYPEKKPEKNLLIETIREEIADIKDMISIAGFGNGMHNMVCNHFESVGILASLLRAGVSESLASEIIQKACGLMDETADQGSKIKSLKKHVMHHCLSQIATKDYFNRDNYSGVPHVAAFVGPTGVGKTTTIAKLAASLSFQRKIRVGLISIDNYRVGAFEQLKAYASIMGLLCVPAFSSQDLSCALDRMKSMDMVLIDTAGHSHFDKAKIDEILQLIKTDFRISTHLVLSVTSESIIMKDAASAFSVFNPDTVVFTKIDETKRCGKILDQVKDLKLPVSLITNGQRVPEDLIIPDKRRLLEIILGKGPKEQN